jgi:hypothetical protein
VLLEDWAIEGCSTAVEIGGGVTCSSFTLRDSVFSAATGEDTTAIRLSGEGKTLELKRLMVDNVLFDGFSIGLKVLNDVLIQDTVKIIHSDSPAPKMNWILPGKK